MKNNIWLLSSLIVLLAGCDRGYNSSLIMVNNIDYDLTMKCFYTDALSSDTASIDSVRVEIYSIAKKSEIVLHEYLAELGSTSVTWWGDSVLFYTNKSEVVLKYIYTQSYYDKKTIYDYDESWEQKKRGRRHIDYTFRIEPSDLIIPSERE